MKNVLFFSRSGYYRIFSHLNSEKFKSLHAVINLQEKKIVEALGGKVVGCFEELYDGLPEVEIDNFYLKTGFYPDRFLGWLKIQERRKILGKLIAFWRKLITENNISACVHETVSYEPEEVLSLVCKELNCKDLNFLVSPLDGFFFWKPDPYSSSFPSEVLENIVPKAEHVEIAQKQINSIKEKSFKPLYLKLQQKNDQKKNWKFLLYKLVRHEINKRFRKHMQLSDEDKLRKSLFYFNDYDQTNDNFYEKLLNDFSVYINDFDNLDDYKGVKFIFYPLHYEPEATLLYFSPNFSEQQYVIQQIVKYLPLDTVLVVKEHPAQKYRLLNYQYSKLRKLNSNLIYLPSDIDSYDLIEKSEAIITICGTVGWEGLVLGKPVYVLGNVFYDKHPGVTKLKNFEDLKTYFGKTNELLDYSAQTTEYLAKIIAYSHEGYYYGEISRTEENLAKFAAAIESSFC